MSQSLKFYRLQQIDSQHDSILHRLEEIEVLISNQEALQQAENYVKSLEAQYIDQQKNSRQAEVHVQDQRIKIEQSEIALYSGKIHNPKELQDLQNEVASLKRYLVTLEDRLLEAMLSEEEAEIALQEANADLEIVRGRTIEQQAHLLAEKTKLTQTRERLEIERQVARNALNPEELDLYDQLRKQRRGVAISKITERTCSACGATLTPALIQSASSPSQITRCPTCGRILFHG